MDWAQRSPSAIPCAFLITQHGVPSELQRTRSLACQVLAWVRGFGDAEREPERFTTAPSLAVPKALRHAKLDIKQVDFFEINEAFSCVDIANRKLLGLPADRWDRACCSTSQQTAVYWGLCVIVIDRTP